MSVMSSQMSQKIDDLAYSEEYAVYIMEHGDRPVGNGDMLLELQEEGYLFNEFLASVGIDYSEY